MDDDKLNHVYIIVLKPIKNQQKIIQIKNVRIQFKSKNRR